MVIVGIRGDPLKAKILVLWILAGPNCKNICPVLEFSWDWHKTIYLFEPRAVYHKEEGTRDEPNVGMM